MGLFYAPDNAPQSLSSRTDQLHELGEGWFWNDGNGDTGYLRPLEENWFYYEAVQLYG